MTRARHGCRRATHQGLFTISKGTGRQKLPGAPRLGRRLQRSQGRANFNPGDAKLQTLADGKADAGFEELLEMRTIPATTAPSLQTVKALADDGTPFPTTFNRHFDRNNYLAWLASAAILLGNWDTVNQNFGLYQPLGGDRFYFSALGLTAPWATRNSPARPCTRSGTGASAPGGTAARTGAFSPSLATWRAAAGGSGRNPQQAPDRCRRQAVAGRLPPIVEAPGAPPMSATWRQGIGHAHAAMGGQRSVPVNVISQNRGFFCKVLQRPLLYWLAVSDKGGLGGLGLARAPSTPRASPSSYQVRVARAGGRLAGLFARRHPECCVTRAGVGPHAAELWERRPPAIPRCSVTASDADGETQRVAFDGAQFRRPDPWTAICA